MENQLKSVNVLVVDDDFGVRESLKMILKERYYVSTTSNPEEAFVFLKKKEPEMVFLDIKMPKINGLDFLKQIHSTNSTIPVIMITAFPSTQTTITALRYGAFDYIVKPFDPSEILTVAEKALHRRSELSEKERLIENLRKSVNQNFLSTAESFLHVIDAKDSYTAGHSKRVSMLFAFVAEELGMHKSKIEVLQYGAFLHDIGKIGVGDSVLGKPSILSEEEFLLMKRHSEIGYKILEPIHFLKECLPMVRHHHEWHSGEGYPAGLKGDEIPFESAILSVVDVYDALTTDRHYHKKYPHQRAFEIITEGIGIQFVPTLTEKVITAIKKYNKIVNQGELREEFLKIY